MYIWNAIPGVRVTEKVGAPVIVAERTLTPVARQVSWRGMWGSGDHGGGGAYLQLHPTAVQIQEEGVADSRLSIHNPMGKSLWLMGGIALAIAAVCSVIMWVAQQVSRVKMETYTN